MSRIFQSSNCHDSLKSSRISLKSPKGRRCSFTTENVSKTKESRSNFKRKKSDTTEIFAEKNVSQNFDENVKPHFLRIYQKYKTLL